MNNKEILNQLKSTFAKLDTDAFAKFTLDFFQRGGGTQLIKENNAVAMTATDACITKALNDFRKGDIGMTDLANYTALLGLASGLTLGVYLMGEVFGLQDQMLDGVKRMTNEELNQKIQQIKQDYSSKSLDIQTEFDNLKIDPKKVN